VSKKILCLILIASSAFAGDNLAKALERLTMTTDMLIPLGDEMVNAPYSGMLLLQDTVSIDIDVNSTYTYQFIIWTESSFNYIDFWLVDPSGEVPKGDLSDHTTFAINPGTLDEGVWQLNMELLEGAYSDTAYYAAAVLRTAK